MSRIASDILRWEFEEKFPVIGLYGYQKTEENEEDSGQRHPIKQVGFYTLDVDCVAITPEDETQGSEFNIDDVNLD